MGRKSRDEKKDKKIFEEPVEEVEEIVEDVVEFIESTEPVLIEAKAPEPVEILVTSAFACDRCKGTMYLVKEVENETVYQCSTCKKGMSFVRD